MILQVRISRDFKAGGLEIQKNSAKKNTVKALFLGGSQLILTADTNLAVFFWTAFVGVITCYNPHI